MELSSLTAEQQAVDDVPHRPREHERQCQAKQLLSRMPAQQINDPDRSRERKRDEEPSLPAGRIRQEAECGSRVVYQHQVEEGGDLDALTKLQACSGCILGQLVQCQRDAREGEPFSHVTQRPGARLRPSGSTRSARTAPDARHRLPRPRADASSAGISGAGLRAP